MINGIPLPKVVSNGLRVKVLELVRKILNSKKAIPVGNTQDLEMELNSIIYELFGLSDDEITLVESKK